VLAASDIIPIPGFSQPFSSISHLFGAALFAVLEGYLLRRGRGNRNRLIFLGIYSFSCVFLFSMSGVYHLLEPGSSGRAVLLRLDHAAIFVLIAGTFTPVHGILYRGIGRWGTLLFIWTAAITGITLKTIFFNSVGELLSLTLFLALGWVGAFSGGVLWYRYGFRFVRPLIWGAIAYTIGGVQEYLAWPTLLDGVIGPHELFHVMVLIGAVLHWCFVYQIANGRTPPRIYRRLAKVEPDQTPVGAWVQP
jgi:channel protein (hemolysin III family)